MSQPKVKRRIPALPRPSRAVQVELASREPQAYPRGVSIEAIRNELRALTAEERRKLMAFMVVLEDEGRADYAAKLAQRIDDPSPDRWVTPEQCEHELGLSGDSK